ncbi:hypothetical protein CROQUDRAFT_673383 [Cronartium quercuum f. sp. fusiforme G11]|uniref:Protein OS-9 homolog n=1 Tax=Cronartium quercuum f. sp. fusiforme G11 TaxID=708437 RepID=A0A9P6T869_9BASI|nr:hypothetical protein CROQUDRAFT_673383 [Cronartium quercuum f. sp. fusiforme G11]
MILNSFISLLLTLNSIFETAISLSSQSPQDLLAYPKYTVNLADWDSAILNSTATALLSTDQQLRPTSDDGGLSILDKTNPDIDQEHVRIFRQRLMRSSNGQAFLCSVPPLPLPKPVIKKSTTSSSLTTSSNDQLKEKLKLEEEGLKKGLMLLESLKDRCIYTRLGWFTYSFCYGTGEIRQFHAIMIPGHNHPHEDPDQDVYVLGLHLSHPQHPLHQSSKVEGTLPSPTASSGELTSLGRNRFSSQNPVIGLSEVMADETNSLPMSDMTWQEEEFEQKRYLVQKWEGGTICDLTGKARSVEVQYHCSTVGTDHIALLRETSICEYLLIIHTPRLCSEPLFLDGGNRRKSGIDEIGKIDCVPILSEKEMKRLRVEKEEKVRRLLEEEEKERQRKEQQKAIDDQVDASTDQQTLETSNPTEPEKSDSPASNEENPTASSSTESDTSTSAKKEDSDESKPLVMDPITVFFDTDTGKIYMDEGNKPTTNPNQAPPAAETRTTTNQPPPSLEELTKALRDSLGAVLRDLRNVEQDGQPQRPQQPLSEILAALKESSTSTKTRSKKKDRIPKKKVKVDNSKVLKNQQLDNHHQKLLNMYEKKFGAGDDDNENNKENQ